VSVTEHFPHEDGARAALRQRVAALGVLECVPVMHLGFEVPNHLAALADVYERAFIAARGEGPPVRALVSAPSQVGKTALGQVAAAWWLNRAPKDNLAFLSYGQDIANIKSAEIRTLVRALGIPLRTDTTAKDLWQTAAGGSFLARGLEGGITGMSGLVLIDIDDPYRNQTEAESSAHKERIRRGYRTAVVSRIHPNTSVVIKHTRWTPDDLIGELSTEDGWEVHRIPAVDDLGEPVVTFRGRTKEFWARQRAAMGEHAWWSLMQGRPRAREGKLFRGAATYEVAPREGRTATGVDFAYSTRSSADYSTIVVLTRTDHRVYVRDVVRVQESAVAFGARIKASRTRYAGPVRAYIGGTERGTIDWLARDGVPIEALPATQDKLSRATACAAAWNAGEIMVPTGAAWVDAFVGEVLDFGVGCAHDDQVDALVAAFDALSMASAESRLLTSTRPSVLGVANERGRRGPW